jgi:hypothetical protein
VDKKTLTTKPLMLPINAGIKKKILCSTNTLTRQIAQLQTKRLFKNNGSRDILSLLDNSELSMVRGTSSSLSLSVLDIIEMSPEVSEAV